MGKMETPQAGAEVKPATDAQYGLIKQLLAETGCEEIPPAYTNSTMNRSDASDYVHFLKEYKVRDQALRSANQATPQFDKIGFGMVYKLVWRACEELSTPFKPDLDAFSDRVTAEYVVFKRCQNKCREFVQDGGLK